MKVVIILWVVAEDGVEGVLAVADHFHEACDGFSRLWEGVGHVNCTPSYS